MRYVLILGIADARNCVFVNIHSVIETKVGFTYMNILALVSPQAYLVGSPRFDQDCI